MAAHLLHPALAIESMPYSRLEGCWGFLIITLPRPIPYRPSLIANEHAETQQSFLPVFQFIPPECEYHGICDSFNVFPLGATKEVFKEQV